MALAAYWVGWHAWKNFSQQEKATEYTDILNKAVIVATSIILSLVSIALYCFAPLSILSLTLLTCDSWVLVEIFLSVWRNRPSNV